MACDLVVAAEGTKLGEPEIRYGSAPVTLLMPYLIGQKKTRELLLTGDLIDAVEAERIGLDQPGRARPIGWRPRSTRWPTGWPARRPRSWVRPSGCSTGRWTRRASGWPSRPASTSARSSTPPTRRSSASGTRSSGATGSRRPSPGATARYDERLAGGDSRRCLTRGSAAGQLGVGPVAVAVVDVVAAVGDDQAEGASCR